MTEISIRSGAEQGVPERSKKGKSRLEFLEEYTVIDIETTGLDPRFNEIIEVAAVRYSNGEETAHFQSLIKPVNPVDAFIEQLTGITNAMLEDAPALVDVLPQLQDFLGDAVLVGHNVNFDINFIYDSFVTAGLGPLTNDFVDTMRLGRRVFPELQNHKLETICTRCSVSNDSAHRALSDCKRTHACYSYIAQYVRENGITLHTLRSSTSNAIAKSLSATTDLFNRDSQIYGKTFAFTGKLELYTRKEAMQAVLNAGGLCGDGVTVETNFLVLGNNDYCKAIKDGKSSKHKKAEKLQLQGQDIAIISESVFFEMLREAQENFDDVRLPEDADKEDMVPAGEQIALTGFEPPYAKEMAAYQEILPQLEEMAASIGGVAQSIAIKHGKTYSSIWYGSALAFRLRLRDAARYIEVPSESKDTVTEIALPEGQKAVAGGFWRVNLGDKAVSDCAVPLGRALQDAINRLPKSWDCCSRYMECSNAKRCVHPDPAFALGCGYRKILASGKIYYGENRNVD